METKKYFAGVSKTTLVAGSVWLLPLVASAQLPTILSNIKDLLNTVIAVLFVLATVIFLWGVIQFIASSGSEEGRKKAKGIMTWGIIGLAVMAAAWGVANILVDFFGVEGKTPTFVKPPEFNK